MFQHLPKPECLRKHLPLILTGLLHLLILESFIYPQEITPQANKLYQKGMKAKTLSEKIDYFKKAVQLEPVFKAAVFELGKSYYQTSDYERAIVHLTQYLHLESTLPKSAKQYLLSAYTFFAGDLNKNGHHQLALENIEQALKIDGKHAPALTVLGSIHVKLGDFPAAILTLEKSTALKHNQEFAWKTLGDLYLQTEAYAKATFAYEQALSIEPKMVDVEVNLATAKSKNSPESWLTRADEAVENNDPEGALTILTKAKSLYPGDELITGKLDSLAQERDYQIGFRVLEAHEWARAFEIFQRLDPEFRQTALKLEEARAELLFSKRDSLLADQVAENVARDSLVREPKASSLRKKQQAPVQQGVHVPNPLETDPTTLSKSSEGDSVALLPDSTQAGPLEFLPAITDAEPANSPGTSSASMPDEFSLTPARKMKPPEIITIPEAIGVISGILILSFLVIKLKNNIKSVPLSRKRTQRLAASEAGFIKTFAQKRDFSKQTEALFRDELASDTLVSFNPGEAAVTKNQYDFDRTRSLKTKPVSKLLSWLETKTILGGIKKVQRIGRYIIEKEIARGTMGRVYKAWDPKLDRTVVIKQVAFDFRGSSPEFNNLKDRLYREAKAAGRLNHPNIITVYDVDEEDGFCFIVMEYLDGEDLRIRLGREGKIKLSAAINIFSQVCDALNYAHQNGIVHRDIKPSNILITKNERVKVADFGIAKLPQLGTLTQTGSVLGTPFYMSPEQIEGRQLDGRSDIFSAGVVLYEMLTGVRPFDGDNIPSLVYKIIHKIPAPPSVENGDLPEAADLIIERALTKEPKKRFATAREFSEALEQFQEEAA